ncbi:GNAT family N-acetyltransferase [uncultured Aquitalea sp.]|uniref:GNAT family N-acetyltransferase n=1 Tax=uncultured Aquitalea sp. TaxID=540272 RepID=UPI0025CEB279|nr:GNAT family N-acetyltransferase [uncultured Aquitalea sp.]
MHFSIRRIEPADAADMARLSNAPGVVRHTSQLPCHTEAAWRKKLDSLPADCHSLVAVDEQDHVIANAGLLLNTRPRCRHAATLFLVVHDDWQGQGVGKALLTALLDLADNWLGLKRIELMAQADNARAIGLYERFGFRHEGISRQDILQDGVYVDSVNMARLTGLEGRA